MCIMQRERECSACGSCSSHLPHAHNYLFIIYNTHTQTPTVLHTTAQYAPFPGAFSFPFIFFPFPNCLPLSISIPNCAASAFSPPHLTIALSLNKFLKIQLFLNSFLYPFLTFQTLQYKYCWRVVKMVDSKLTCTVFLFFRFSAINCKKLLEFRFKVYNIIFLWRLM